MNSEEINNFVQLFADELGGEFNVTENGVPRIIMKGSEMKISLVYVAKSNIWKAFHPFPSSNQTREYFESSEQLVKFLQEKGCKIE